MDKNNSFQSFEYMTHATLKSEIIKENFEKHLKIGVILNQKLSWP